MRRCRMGWRGGDDGVVAKSQLEPYFLRNGRLSMSAVAEAVRAAPRRIDPVAALRGFFHIMDAWGVAAEQARIILGAPAERTYYAWRAGSAVRVPADTLRRIGYVAGIYKALQIL